MKKTINIESAASVTLRYLLHFISIALFYGIMIYSTNKFWLPFLVKKLTKIYYVSGTFGTQLIALLIIYCLFCYFVNNFVLDLYRKGKEKQLILSVIADLLIIPLSILLVIVYYNKTSKNLVADTDNLYNIYLITVLLLIKELITARLVSKKSDSANSLKLKTSRKA
jgi:hypothetical protein